jgi:hypothetical protein
VVHVAGVSGYGLEILLYRVPQDSQLVIFRHDWAGLVHEAMLAQDLTHHTPVDVREGIPWLQAELVLRAHGIDPEDALSVALQAVRQGWSVSTRVSLIGEVMSRAQPRNTTYRRTHVMEGRSQ